MPTLACVSRSRTRLPTTTAGCNLDWVDAEDVERNGILQRLAKADGILVPGGFGERGIEGKIMAARYARQHKVPYLGLCLGMQVMVIELARQALGYEQANSSEFCPGYALSGH